MKLDEHLDKYNRIKLEEKKRKIEKMLTIWGKCNQYATGCSYNKKRESDPNFLTIEDDNLYLLVASTLDELRAKNEKLFNFALDYYIGFKFIDGGYEEDLSKKMDLIAVKQCISKRTCYNRKDELISYLIASVSDFI